MPISRKLDYVILNMIESSQKTIRAAPMNLGGIPGSGGGAGTPPGGFIGWLPQTRVAYDLSEVESLSTPGSGQSLLDNLNHIRYRLGTLESGGSIFVVDENTATTYSDVDTIHFSGGVTVTNLGSGDIRVAVTASGGSGASVADIGSTAETVGGSVDNGTALTASRSDHKHAITTPKLDDLATADDNTDLNANTTNHGLLLKATAPTGTKINVVGIANGETAYTNKDLIDSMNTVVHGSTSVGPVLDNANEFFMLVWDTVSAWLPRKVTWNNIKSDLGAFFPLIAHNHQGIGSNGSPIDHGLAIEATSLLDDDHPQYIKHSLATAINDFLVASGVGVFVKKTLAETITILRTSLDSIYQAAGSYLTSANIDDTAYNATSWDGDTTHAPSKNAIRDKIETMGGTGDVVGPASAVDNNLAAFDLTTGKLIKDSGVLTSNAASAVSLKHTQGTDDALGTLGTKNPPIDADLAIYRDSTASSALVTSTWAQVKAFLKTYWDTLYAPIAKGVTNGDSHDHNGGDGNAITDANLSTSDITTNDASTSKHGFLKKLSNVSTEYMSGTGVFSTPAGGALVINNYLTGLGMTNSAGDTVNDIDIALGYCADSTNAGMMTLAAGITKRLDAAWAVGTNNGGLDTGSIANTTYHVWLIKRSDTSVVDALFSTSATAPTMPANYDSKRRIGSIVRLAGTIKQFIQNGNYFDWQVPVNDVNDTDPGTAAMTKTLTLPTGIRVRANISCLGVGTSGASSPQNVWVSDLSMPDTAPTFAVMNFSQYNGSAVTSQLGVTSDVWTNTSAQVRERVQVSAATTQVVLNTNGWFDPRGQ